jgi:hypothetical protein
MEEMIATLNKWVANGIAKLPEAPKKATEKDKKNLKFCHFHQYIHHSTADCWTLRRKYHEKIHDSFLKHKNKAVVLIVIHGNSSDSRSLRTLYLSCLAHLRSEAY